jgi:hypothetical protein
MGGRFTPKGTRPQHLRPVGEQTSEGSPIDQMIDSAGRELLEKDDPFAAEMWASVMVGMFDRARLQGRLDGMEVPPFEEALLHRCLQLRDKRAAGVAAALAAVVPPPHDRTAASVAAELRRSVPGLPGWVGRVGASRPTRAWVASDVFGDQDSLIVGFAQEGDSLEHALVVLVDHNLSGQAKDAWIADDFDDVVARWKSTGDPHMRGDDIAVDRVLGRLRDAMAMSDLWNGDSELRTDEFAEHRALIWSRLRHAGLTDDRPADLEQAPTERDALVSEFMASPEGLELTGSLAGAEGEILAGYLVNLRCDYGDGPLRWSPIVVSLLLGDLAPRKLLLDGDQAAALPAVVRALARYSGARTGLDPCFVDETLEAVDRAEPEFLDRINDPAAAGPAKALLAALQARGVDITDVDALNQALQEAGPMKLHEAAPKRRRSTAAASVEVVSSAEAAHVLGRFELLAGFFGDGRKLTQTGHPTLADARVLISLLGTRDRMDETIGDRTFKTQSAARLPELGFMIRWAVTAGVLRKEHGKLRATTAWSKLAGKPLQRWMKAADALPPLGPIAGFQANNRYGGGDDEMLDELMPEILDLIVQGGLPFESVLDWICDVADIEYEWFAPYMDDPKSRRRSFGWDLDLLVRILGWAGIAERADATVEPDRYDGERLVGGTLQLTPVGRWWLTDQ